MGVGHPGAALGEGGICFGVIGVLKEKFALVEGEAPASGSTPTFTIAPLPGQQTGEVRDLNGISCPAANECVAVGYAVGETALVATYSAGSWTMAPIPAQSNDMMMSVA